MQNTTTCGYLPIGLTIFFSFTGNIRLPLLPERIPREVSDSYKLPSPSLALPSDWRAAQPSHTEGGGAQPLRGPFCSGPYGRLIEMTYLLYMETHFPPMPTHSCFSFFFVKWPLCTRDHWDKILTWKDLTTLHPVLVWLCLQGSQ